MSDATVSRGRSLFLIAGRVALLGLGLALAGCQTDGTGYASGSSKTLAFESIDGPPKATFEKLVTQLTTEAQTQKVSVVSRAEPAAYRVRGYLAVNSSKDKTAVTYVWDVFDANKQRVARLTGEEVVKRPKGDAWQACDEDVLNRIAGMSMAALAETVGAPPPAPSAAPATAAAPVAEPKSAEPAAPAAAPPITGDGPPVAEAPHTTSLAYAAQ
ncbi:MAG: hypothetical protein AB1592_13900 [Pseudomonadota bacterium]